MFRMAELGDADGWIGCGWDEVPFELCIDTPVDCGYYSIARLEIYEDPLFLLTLVAHSFR